jgi:ABC-type transporter lipoprotein component MlaA
VETDIAGDKKIFRRRHDVGRFFAHYDLSEGDHVVIERLSAHEYRISPAR